jgi:hypothetical protein
MGTVVIEDVPFSFFQFTITEIKSVWLDLDDDKTSDPDGVPLLVLKNCASAFAVSF